MRNFTFDGVGVNDANDEYKRRVATLAADYMKPEIGNLLAAAPELLHALELVAWEKEGIDDLISRTVRVAIAKARGE